MCLKIISSTLALLPLSEKGPLNKWAQLQQQYLSTCTKRPPPSFGDQWTQQFGRWMIQEGKKIWKHGNQEAHTTNSSTKDDNQIS